MPPAVGEAQRGRAMEMIESGKGLDDLGLDIGSNAYGFGRQATESGRGLVLGNPHFPWDGAERLYQVLEERLRDGTKRIRFLVVRPEGSHVGIGASYVAPPWTTP